MDYKNTLNLPNTEFPMKASLSAREPERIKAWEDNKLYEKMIQEREGCENYILHDGPPYANGSIHIGHALNKILKDFIIKIKYLQNYKTPYIPGWDCHGLPIEHQVDKKLGKKKQDMTKSEIRKLCRDYAAEFIDIQREEFKRLGVFGKWEAPYVTMDYYYEAKTLEELYKFFENGGVFKGLKPVYWCHKCVTALAEAEVEYDNHTSTSVYVKFAVRDESKTELGFAETDKLSAVIWTTTPWTLPANMAVCAHADFEYSAVKITSAEAKNLEAGEIIIVAKEMIETLQKEFGGFEYETVKSFKGIDLENKKCKHPFYDRDSQLIVGDHVTLEAGTGLVHTAPGHGQEDYVVALKYGIEVYNPVNDYGKYRPDVEFFAGEHINKANPTIVEMMNENGSLINHADIEHSYPHCWRCKSPVIFRATPQWFISMEANNLRENALKEIERVQWTPSWGQNRIRSMVQNRPDWCISRQRTWGVPIAVYLCDDCGEVYYNNDFRDKVLSAFREEGADAWFNREDSELLPDGAKCSKCSSTNLKKETDILDVWFDSGVSHAAVCEEREELTWPANMYLEGSDQHRGWFHSTLLESVGSRGVAPYSEVLTHGFVVDGKGRKMSKSAGNVTSPDEIIKQYGAEILRLWVSGEDYSEDIRISPNIISRLVESYRKIRNTMRYILGSVNDFNPDTDTVAFDELLDLDRYILIRWQKAKERIFEAYNKYQFHTFYHTFMNFCITELSAFYLDIIKDRTYSYAANSKMRRSAQTALFTLVKEMSIVMSPILTFTADEVWEFLPKWNDKKDSVFLTLFPEVEKINDEALEKKWASVIELRKEVNKALELARTEKVIGHPLDAKVEVEVPADFAGYLKADEGIEKIFIVSEFVQGKVSSPLYTSEDGRFKIAISKSELQKCSRCWVHSDTIGQNAQHPEICSRCVEALG